MECMHSPANWKPTSIQMLREIAVALRLKLAGADVYDSRLKRLVEQYQKQRAEEIS